ncbi:molybdenum cofactor biosynthesis protein A [Actinoalloteichus sp. GBA129-24]|uniref:GTP 3',8-cyclase n=1 Tax=Actinoalloteichus fjordicus TaxID=1612552 RepID=A0AAC9LHH5_9PSEU|nr:molybdenum cofactor biosynthesis protein A [Actinoalloteichus fjordicus]APU23759.1 molybdenum cofactor biosynthesis protein A [Actinoalloteichus sp. GBA129-24]
MELGIPVVPGATGGTAGGEPRPAADGLIDRYGRTATDLRVSLIDRCNLRCSYCMPAEGLDWLAKSSLLDTEELRRLLRIAVERLGVRDVRFTGGEPLLRKDLTAIVANTARLRPRPRISLTTNGIGLRARAVELAEAGLDRINVSLDTLRPDLFHTITRRRRLDDVLAGLAAASAAGLDPVKINAVLLRGVNDDEAPDLLRFALDGGYHLRFIEQMPLDAQHGWQRSEMITAEEILRLLQERFTLTPHQAERGSAPAERWSVDGGPGTVGVIGSVTRPFCAACDRTRLTADGQLRSCLFSQTETDLRGPLRSGADDEELATIWRAAMWGKPAGHGIDDESFTQPRRPMSAIGG